MFQVRQNLIRPDLLGQRPGRCDPISHLTLTLIRSIIPRSLSMRHRNRNQGKGPEEAVSDLRDDRFGKGDQYQGHWPGTSYREKDRKSF